MGKLPMISGAILIPISVSTIMSEFGHVAVNKSKVAKSNAFTDYVISVL